MKQHSQTVRGSILLKVILRTQTEFIFYGIEKGKYKVPAVQGTLNSFVGCSELTKLRRKNAKYLQFRGFVVNDKKQ